MVLVLVAAAAAFLIFTTPGTKCTVRARLCDGLRSFWLLSANLSAPTLQKPSTRSR